MSACWKVRVRVRVLGGYNPLVSACWKRESVCSWIGYKVGVGVGLEEVFVFDSRSESSYRGRGRGRRSLRV